MEFVLILGLIFLNGLLSMAEIAFVTVKRTRLQKLRTEGDMRSELILHLLEEPNKFFSTIQVGITLIGVLTGAVGGVTLSAPVSQTFQEWGIPLGVSNTIAFSIVVVILTYLSIVLGELVPKRLGMHFPEKVTLFMARPMNFLSNLFLPVINVLSGSTDAVLRIFQLRQKKQLPISSDELKLMLQEGAQLGVFEAAERNIVEKALSLSDIKVNSLMTARNNIVWIEKATPFSEIKKIVTDAQHSYYPVCDKELDDVVGVISADTLLTQIVTSDKTDLKRLLHKPILIPENKKVLHVLEHFKRTRIHMGLIVDEYGTIEGLITITDILEAIVGDLPDINEKEERKIIKRSHNTWFVDGLLSITDFKEHFQVEEIPNEKSAHFHTIGGFVMDHLGKVPVSGEGFDIDDFRIEVVDMDGNRVDKVIVTKLHE